jgi:hypothetical protein
MSEVLGSGWPIHDEELITDENLPAVWAEAAVLRPSLRDGGLDGLISETSGEPTIIAAGWLKDDGIVKVVKGGEVVEVDGKEFRSAYTQESE